MIKATGGVVRSHDSPTMMCSAEVTGSLVPTVAKQIQSVEPEKEQSRHDGRGADACSGSFNLKVQPNRTSLTCRNDSDAK